MSEGVSVRNSAIDIGPIVSLKICNQSLIVNWQLLFFENWTIRATQQLAPHSSTSRAKNNKSLTSKKYASNVYTT